MFTVSKMSSVYEKYMLEVNEYFKNKSKCKKHCNSCVYLGTPEERMKKYREIRNKHEEITFSSIKKEINADCS